MFYIGFVQYHVHLIPSQIWPLQAPAVLTRRDQLKLKEQKERAKKEKKVANEDAKADKIQEDGEVKKKPTQKKSKSK